MVTSTRAPVIALDVDGVLNPEDDPVHLGPGWKSHHVQIPTRYHSASPFSTMTPGRDAAFTVHLNRDLHGAWITRMRRKALVVWATSWEHSANFALAPLLGIVPLPVGISVLAQKPSMGMELRGESWLWKAKALDVAFPGRPVVWIDDTNRYWQDGWNAQDSVSEARHHGWRLRPILTWG